MKHYLAGESVTLYSQSSGQPLTGKLVFTTSFPKQKLIYQKLALFCLTLSVFGFFLAALPVIIGQIQYEQNLHQQNTLATLPQEANIPMATTTPSTPSNSISEASPSSDISSAPVSKEFRIIIPKINLSYPVIPEVDPNSESAYKTALLTGIAHTKGSYLPGETGPVLLFAHSTDSIFDISRYNAKFYALKDVLPGDEVDILYHGKKYHYTVTSQMTISPTDINVIRDSKADLILQTCWPPGTDWQRLLVFAHLDSSSDLNIPSVKS